MIFITASVNERRQNFGPPLPKYITKYVNKEAINHVCKGSFQIGTSKYYRGMEDGDGGNQALSIDQHEGSVITTVADANSRVDLPEFGLINIQSYNCGTGLTVEDVYNGWLFCATGFRYDSVHHKAMQHGIGNYLGNSDNTEFVVLDTDIFFPALYREAAERYTAIKAMVVDVVRYGEKELFVPTDEFAGAVTLHAYRALTESFIKPVYFEPEHEIRAVFLTDPSFDFEKVTDPFFRIRSDELKLAIVQSSLTQASGV